MFCIKCGSALPENSKFCHTCGEVVVKPETVKVPMSENVVSSMPHDHQACEMVNKRNHKSGMRWFFVPWLIILAISFSYSISTFVISTISPDGGLRLVGSLISVILGFFGIIAVILMLIGIPIGIIQLNKRKYCSANAFDPRSGKGASSEIPPEIQGWNWGAAGLGWIWGVSHGVWISLLGMIPVVNIVMIILLGLKGNEWAWRANKWESMDEFVKTQNKWKPWGIVFFILGILGIISSISKM